MNFYKIILSSVAAVLVACVSSPVPRGPTGAAEAQNVDTSKFGYTPYLTQKFAKVALPSDEEIAKMLPDAAKRDAKAFAKIKKLGRYEAWDLKGEPTALEPGRNRWNLPYCQPADVWGTKRKSREPYIVVGNYVMREPWVAAATQSMFVYEYKNGKYVGAQMFSEFAAAQIQDESVVLIRMMGDREADLWAARDTAKLIETAQEIDQKRPGRNGFWIPNVHFNVGRVFYENGEQPKTLTVHVPTAKLREWVKKKWAIIGFYDETNANGGGYGGIEIAVGIEAWPELAALVTPASIAATKK